MAASGAHRASPNEVPCANQPSQPRSAQHSWSSPPSPSPAAVSPSPLCAASTTLPSCCPLPSPPSRSVPVGQGKKDTYLFFPLSSPAPQLCSPTTPRIPPPRSLSPSLLSFFALSLHRSIPLPSKKPCPLVLPIALLVPIDKLANRRFPSHRHHDRPQEKAGGGGAGLTPERK